MCFWFDMHIKNNSHTTPGENVMKPKKEQETPKVVIKKSAARLSLELHTICSEGLQHCLLRVILEMIS